ncbi:hypothetical protein WMY93_030493 [Mugilogobius chulae]|uniref:LRRCT domain-containing protein n=1 Tax=Mugilogobius chulae TaxID=88201 RepID=A0AAW0MNI4_9GOBI
MIVSLIFCIFPMTTMTSPASAHPCRCTVHSTEGFTVNCSSSKLSSIPYLTPDTTELHLSNTGLSTVPPGLFDKLVGLKKLSLTGNPFHCDCRIQYLRNWLLKNKYVVTKEPTCASPNLVTQKPISELSDEFFTSCLKPSCTNWIYLIIIGMLFCV